MGTSTITTSLFCCCDGSNEHEQPELTEEGLRLQKLEEQRLAAPLTEQEARDYENLVWIAQERNVRVTIRTSAKAGVVAGLCVAGGVIVAGPVGAVVGGAAGTALAASMAKTVVSVKDLLKRTPRGQQGKVYRVFATALKDEFQQGFTQNPELKLLLSGGSVIAVMRYCLEKEMIDNDQLDRLDGILKRIS